MREHVADIQTFPMNSGDSGPLEIANFVQKMRDLIAQRTSTEDLETEAESRVTLSEWVDQSDTSAIQVEEEVKREEPDVEAEI